MRKPTSLKLAYAAGLVDGEGTITLIRTASNQHRAPVLSLSSTSYELIEIMVNLFGGVVSHHKTYKKHHRRSYSWRLVYSRALDVMRQLLPFLREKKKIARIKHLLKGYAVNTRRNGKYSVEDKKKKAAFEAAFFKV